MLSLLLSVSSVLRADRAADLARIHTEAIGGKERIAALGAIRVTGQVISGEKQVRFTMTAARPNRVRLETVSGDRTLVQGTDGVEPPWEFDTGTWPPKYRPMAESVAKTFVADAEFDDPLVAGATRGYRFDFAGEVEADGRKLFRLLTMRGAAETYSVLIDAVTYLIVMRVEERTLAMGRKVQVVTRYRDFLPVAGVLLPHEVITSVDGRTTQKMKISRVEANPALSADTFTRPKSAAPAGNAR
jgi:hypothetical protein